MNKKLVIIGEGEFGEIAYEYFTHDSDYEVVAFAVEGKYKTKNSLFDLPIIELEKIKVFYPPEKFDVFTAITFTQFNRVRTRIYQKCKEMGYSFATYVSSNAFVWRNAQIGENSFIFEDNTIQYHLEIGNNTVLWSGNHIGHRAKIGNNCFLTSHVVVSGYCTVGDNSFLGVNATLGDNVDLPKDTLLAAGSVTVKSLAEPGRIYMGSPAKPIKQTVYEKFNLNKES